MFTNKPWILYGATGRTGTLIAEEAVARGHRPMLAGRDPDRLRSLAERLDLSWVAGPVIDLARLIGDARLVLLAAGPFGSTAPAALRASLDAGVHYLDIANDLPVAAATLAADDEARQRGITALPAVGFGTVASDGLARYVTDQVPGAIQLDLAILLGTDGSSAGAKASTMHALAGGVLPGPDATDRRQARDAVLPVVARAAGKLPPRATSSGTATETPATVNSYLWAQATAADGRTAQAWVRTGEGYAYTARSAVLAVEATLQSEPLGATTVARAFGSELSFEAGGELLAAA